MIRWNRFRRQTMILTAPALLELAEILREVDEELTRSETCPYNCASDWTDSVIHTRSGQVPVRGLRSRLEKLLGMHPGSLDTSKDGKRT